MPKATKKEVKLLERILDRYDTMLEFDRDNRQEAMIDMKFVNIPGEQWDENMKQERGERPCYEFNKLRVTGKRVINDMRANRPAGKVRGVEGADKDTAEVYEGLIRNIWNTSDGDTVIDYAAEYQVNGGMGAWRISTKYSSDTAFEQDIVLEPIINPFCLFFDQASKDPQRSDAMDCILTEKISKDSYETRWPDAKVVDFEETEFDNEEEWEDDESVRIAEYWYKEAVKKEIWQLQDGKVVDSESDEAANIPKDQIKGKRTVDTYKVMMCIASGEAILEGPKEWAGSMLPFVVVYGDFVVIDGKTYWFGLPRFAKDAQRSYNVSRTAIIETVAMAPQAKWWMTAAQAKGNTAKIAEAHRKNFPFLVYNPDPKAPGPPARMGAADIPIALIEESRLASEEIKAVTGIFSPDLGAGDQAKSGVQERERRAQGQIATFNYQDNQAKGIRRTWELLIDLIPQIYDTDREMRILGSDGAEDYVRINTFVQDQETGEMIKVHDMAQGRFDTTITTGPSFSTRREEASEVYMAMAQRSPEIMSVAGDLIFKATDLPYSEDIAERLQAMLPPQIQQLLNKDDQGQDGAAMMQQAAQAMQMVEEQMQQVQQAAQEAETGKQEVEKLISSLQVEEAQFEAKVAKELAKVQKAESKLQINQFNGSKDAQLQQNQEILADQMAEAVLAINQLAEQFTAQAVEALSEIQDQNQISNAPKPKVVRIESKRENGNLVAVPIYEDTAPTGQSDADEAQK